jgi:hypothetical protein
MAHRLIGRTQQQIEASPAARTWVAYVVHSCLTTPFDYAALRCLNESRQLTRCLDDLVRRNPERRESAAALLKRISRK